jgi:predicted enzyme related to lactoylglutathione lyase
MTSTLLTALAAGVALAQTPAPPLRVSMISLGVKDSARSIRFYGDTLGLPLVGKPGEVTFFRAGEITLVLNHPAGRGFGGAVAGAVEIIFPVESVEASFRDLTRRGCNFLREPREVTPGTWAATFTDPDGHRLTILGAR